MSFSLPADVKNSDITRLVTEAAMPDDDVQQFIDEGDLMIESALALAGYDCSLAAVATSKWVKGLSIRYGRAATLRALYHRGPDTNAGDGHKDEFDRIEEQLKLMRDGEVKLKDPSTNLPLDTTLVADKSRIESNTTSVPRTHTMAKPETQVHHPCLYSDQEVLGEQQGDTAEDCVNDFE